MTSNWLDPEKWRDLQASVPIACVDVLPLQLESGDEGILTAVGLILRETPHQGQRWCLVGGRLLRNESVADAIARQLRETLGDEIEFEVNRGTQPDYVAEYFTVRREIGGFDPRQHAVGLTYSVAVQGAIHPRGEALSFAWFDPCNLPTPEKFGFDQDRVVAACVTRLLGNLSYASSPR